MRTLPGLAGRVLNRTAAALPPLPTERTALMALARSLGLGPSARWSNERLQTEIRAKRGG
jgi:hypothetical protein